MTKRFSTLKDVAKEAGVSFITVSRVVNNSGYVRKETREKILKVIRKLNYQPLASARKLKSLKSNVISIIVSDIKSNFFANIIESAEDIITKNNMDIMIFNSKFSCELEEKFLNLSVANRAEGIILTKFGRSRKTINNILTKNKIPMVILESYLEDVNADFVIHQNFRGSYILTEHLIKEHNHKKIGAISVQIEDKSDVDRLNGYKQALIDNNIKFDENLVLYGKATPENGYNLTKSLISQNKGMEALVCLSTVFAIGAIKALRDLKIEVPRDLALVAFDEYDINTVVNPTLTSLKRVDRQFGEKAANLLLKRIKEKKVSKKSVIEIPAELSIGESCGCLV